MNFVNAMSRRTAAIARKILSLALIFNSLVSIVSAANILASSYATKYYSRQYSPYLVDGSLVWFIILTAILNIGPAKFLGRVKLRRMLFHHYVYGFLASSVSTVLMAIFAPASIVLLLVPSLGFQVTDMQAVPVYAGLFFVYGGLTLIIDDIHDVSLSMGRALDKLKTKVPKSNKVLQAMHLWSSLISTYVLICSVLWYSENGLAVESWPFWNAPQLIFIVNLLVTSSWGLKAVMARPRFAESKSGSADAQTGFGESSF